MEEEPPAVTADRGPRDRLKCRGGETSERLRVPSGSFKLFGVHERSTAKTEQGRAGSTPRPLPHLLSPRRERKTYL